MKEHFDLLVIIPIGPNCTVSFITDTIESFKFYTSCKYKIILSDDSQKKTGEEVKKIYPEITVLTTTKNYGRWGGLYITLSLAFLYAIKNYHFKALLRMDTDALITGPEPQEEAIKQFQENPNIGMSGFYRLGEFTYDCFGNKVNNSWPRKQLLKDTCSWKIIRRPIANFTLRKLFFKAVRNGYEIGENVFGGAYFISENCLMLLHEAGLLPQYKLSNVHLEEDHLFSLMVRYVGMEFGDLESGTHPFGVTWQGLPASPEVLYKTGKKIIHSTRYWKDMKEDEIRAYFKKQRENEFRYGRHEVKISDQEELLVHALNRL